MIKKTLMIAVILFLIGGCSSKSNNQELMNEYQEIQEKNTTINSYSGDFQIDLDPDGSLGTNNYILIQLAGINLNKENHIYKAYTEFSSGDKVYEFYIKIDSYNMLVNDAYRYELPKYQYIDSIFNGLNLKVGDIKSISSSGVINDRTAYTIKLKNSVNDQYLEDFAAIVYPELKVQNVKISNIQYILSVDEEKYIRVISVTFDIYFDVLDGYYQNKLRVLRSFDSINTIKELNDVDFYTLNNVDND